MTVGEMIKVLKALDKDEEIFVWDEDSHTLKGIESAVVNGTALQLNVENWEE